MCGSSTKSMKKCWSSSRFNGRSVQGDKDELLTRVFYVTGSPVAAEWRVQDSSGLLPESEQQQL